MYKNMIDRILGRITLQPYLAPVDSDTGGGIALDDADILEDDKDDDKPEDDKEDKEPEEDEEAEKEENEDDEENDEDDEKDKEDEDDDKSDDKDDKEEDAELDRITHASDLKKAYPDIFKKFPDIKSALYRDQRYGEIFANPDEAESTVKQAVLLQQIESDLIVDGNPRELLTAIKKDNAESYGRVISDILPFLQENDKENYLKLAALPIKQLLRRAFKDGKGKETDLGRAALYIHKFFFDNYNVEEKVELEESAKKKDGKSAREVELEKKLAKFDEDKYNTFHSSVSESYVTRMSAVITEGIKNDDRLTEYTKSKLVEDILKDIRDQMEKDVRYQRSIQSIWQQAKTAGFSNDFKSRIVSTALARAKSLVPTVRAKLVAQALGKKVRDSKENKEEKKVSTFQPRKEREAKRPEKKSGSANPDLDILRGA